MGNSKDPKSQKMTPEERQKREREARMRKSVGKFLGKTAIGTAKALNARTQGEVPTCHATPIA